MNPRRRFRPSGTWTLEDRIALSHAGAAEVSALLAPGLSTTVHGTFRTTLSAGIGGGETSILSATGRFAGVGQIKLAGALSSNPSLPPLLSKTAGTITLNTTSKHNRGFAAATLTGPASELAPNAATTTHLQFVVANASGSLATLMDTHGSADLTLHTRGKPHGNVRSGNFTLVLTVA